MVKSYTRYELEATFGIVSSSSSVSHIDLPRSPGRIVVGAGEAVQIWDLKTGELTARFVDPQQNPKAQVVHVSYESQSEIIAAGYTDGSVRVWDVRSASVMVTFHGHRSAISVLEFNQDGTQLFSASADTTIIAWDLINEQGLYRLKGHKAMITGLGIIDEKRLISTAKDGIIKVWDIETQFAVESHVAHKGECWGIVLLNKNRVATVSNGTDIKIWSTDWDKAEGSQLEAVGELTKNSKYRGVKLLFDSKTSTLHCASGDTVQSWKQRSNEELKKLMKRKQKRAEKSMKSGDKLKTSSDGTTESLEKSEDSAVVQLSASDEYLPVSLIRTKSKISGLALGRRNEVLVNLAANSLECWTVSGESSERTFSIDRAGHRTDVRDAAVSGDGRLIATGSNGSIKVYNQRSGQVVRTLAETGYVLALLFLPGDSLLVSGTKEGNIDVYDLARAVRICSVNAHNSQAVWSLDLSSDGLQLVSGGADKVVKFWTFKVNNDEMVLKNTHKLEFNDDVLAVKLSPDMRFIAVSLLDSTVKVYYRDTLKFYLNLYGHQLPVLSIDISHDSKLLVTSSADKNVKIWGLDFGDCHKSIFAHDDSVLRVKFEPNTHNFVSSSKDGFVKYWDGTKFVQIQKLEGHHSEVWALAMAQDGSFFVSASHDKTVRIWQMTDEPLFIEEEREAEAEQQYEDSLLESLEKDENTKQNDEDGEDEGSGDLVKKHTTESLKAGERLYEALDICTTDLEEKPNPRHVILAALNVAPERYLMDVLMKIKAPIVEDALLTFPLDRILSLLKFILIWLEKQWNLTLVCRVLFFCLRTFHRQIVANKMLQPELEAVRDQLRNLLNELAENTGFNLAQMKWIQSIWDESHTKLFDLEDSKKNNGTRKRVYGTVSV